MSQTPRHIWRNAEDTVALDEIFGVDDIATADSVLVLLTEAQKRVCGISHAGLHFDGIYFILRFAVIGENKVDFNVVPFLFIVVVRIEKQTMTVRGEHLRDGIFKKHPLVQTELSRKDLLINLIFQKFVLVKRVADQQPGIT